MVVDAECQLPTETQEGSLCIVRRPEHYIGKDALFVRTGSEWKFKCCGTVPETTTYKGEVTRAFEVAISEVKSSELSYGNLSILLCQMFRNGSSQPCLSDATQEQIRAILKVK